MAENVFTKCKMNIYESPAGKIAIVTMDNGQDYKKPNTWSMEALDSLSEAVDQVAGNPEIVGWILTGKPFIFNVGADILGINLGISQEEALAIGQKGHAVFSKIMNLSIPTLAAINGACMGGGLEVALYHDYRAIAASPGGADLVALPECFLNLVPGWGGTQLLTKLAGPAVAVEMIIRNPLNFNKMIKAPQVLELGIADAMFAPAEFLDDAIKLLIGIITGEAPVERKVADPVMSDEFYQQTLEFITGKVHRGAVAPYKALELIKLAGTSPLEEGFAAEDAALAALITSKPMHNSVYSFDLTQRRAKRLPGRPEGVQGLKINKIGIVGAGLMAAQMALAFLQKYKVPVVMKDIKQEFLDKGVKSVKDALAALVKKGRMSEADAKWMGEELLVPTLDYGEFADCDFVIEAVFESMALKKQIFADLEAACKPECLFLTNTSSLSITAMAADLQDPSRVAGFHFFNPISVMPLVEAVRAEETSDVALATVFDIAARLRKTPILVKDAPAFLVNRVLLAWMDGIMGCIDQGADIAQVDKAILDMGFPMSPFFLLAMVGPPVALHVQETLNAAWPERFPVYAGFKAMVEAGKTVVDAEVVANWPQGDKKFTDEEIQAATMRRVAEEVALLLKEGVVASPKDVDTGMILGAGWPFAFGGVTPLLAQNGWAEAA